MDFYNSVALNAAADIDSADVIGYIRRVIDLPAERRLDFPNPRWAWIEATYDAAAQWDAYTHLCPIKGNRVLQLGGSGLHAVKFLLAGSDEAWLISPMIGELVYAKALAAYAGVADRLKCVVGIGEEIPVANSSFAAVFCGGCVHHMVTERAMPEISRVLSPGGRFAAVEPWRAPFYGIGTKLFGKREEKILGTRGVDVFCRPMTSVRVEPMYKSFVDCRVIHHGTLTRYPLLMLWKLGVKLPDSFVWNVNLLDDYVCNLIPGVRQKGSSVALLGTGSSGSATRTAI